MDVKKIIEHIFPVLIEASEAIMSIYQTPFEVETKADHSPVTIADKTSSKIILRGLEPLNIPIISEEEEKPAYEDRKNEEYLWLVDPLDGTKEFIAKNNQFCICIALIHQGKSVLGFIADPTKKRICFGGEGLDSVYITPFNAQNIFDKSYQTNNLPINNPMVLAHSNHQFSGSVLKTVRLLEKHWGKMNVLRKGSALKFIDLAEGKADLYLRLAPTMEWDIAAGQAIFNQLGGEVMHFHTHQPLRYNKPQLKNPYFIALRAELRTDFPQI